jgi:hypothetical protein
LQRRPRDARGQVEDHPQGDFDVDTAACSNTRGDEEEEVIEEVEEGGGLRERGWGGDGLGGRGEVVEEVVEPRERGGGEIDRDWTLRKRRGGQGSFV